MFRSLSDRMISAIIETLENRYKENLEFMGFEKGQKLEELKSENKEIMTLIEELKNR